METIARPLYRQVQDALTARIADGVWKAGQVLPSEFALADELGVSQGTVRKALNAMAAENLLDRHQGRGTYVPEHTEARALFHFYRMQSPDGTPALPEPSDQRLEMMTPDPAIARDLGTGRRKIWRIGRTRSIAGQPAILERIFLDPRRFPGLAADTVLPNALYSYYQASGGVSIVRADDRLSAVAADADLAASLDISTGAPLLFVERYARDIRGDVAEVRHSWFRTEAQAYAVTLR